MPKSLAVKKVPKTHKYIKKIVMKGRNVNGWRSIDEKDSIVIHMNESFKKDIKLILGEREHIKPTDIIRELVKEEANRLKSSKAPVQTTTASTHDPLKSMGTKMAKRLVVPTTEIKQKKLIPVLVKKRRGRPPSTSGPSTRKNRS
jgi:hypothetical protein